MGDAAEDIRGTASLCARFPEVIACRLRSFPTPMYANVRTSVMKMRARFITYNRPTVSSAKNYLVCFSSTGYIDHPVWRGHCDEAKREPLGAHRITRNEGAMAPFLLPGATPGLVSIAAWCGSGTTAVVICVNTAARPRRAEPAVRGDILSVWQVIHGTPSAPCISAQRVAQFDGHGTSNLLTNNQLRQRYSRFSL